MGLGEYTVDIDMVTAENLIELMERAWCNRDKNREILKQNITSWTSNLGAEMARLPEHLAQKK
jgi:hypothetical protein